MSDLEGKMKSVSEDILLADKRKVFTPSDQAVLTEWSFKVTVLANHMQRSGDPFFSYQERRTFATKRIIPKGVHVWIAQRYARGHVTGLYRSVQTVGQPQTPIMPHLITLPVSPFRFRTYTCTFNIGFLVLQLLSFKWTEPQTQDAVEPMLITQAEQLNDLATAIWPPKQPSVQWPPPVPITNAMMERYWNRFESFQVPGWMSSVEVDR